METDYLLGGYLDFALLDEIRSYSDNEVLHAFNFYKLTPKANLQAWRMVGAFHYLLIKRGIRH